MLEENISEKSAFVRLVLGIGLTACGISHLVKENGSRMLGTLSVAAGAMKIAEGLFFYCPTKALFSNNVKDAVSSSIQDFMDADSLMTAFNSKYNSGNQNQSQSSQAQSASGNEGAELLQTAANVAEKVASTTPAGTEANQAAKAVKAVANSQKRSK
ncbi:MAG: DUF2892 domain-containing protein [Bacilli bacterium]|uniref:YgaP family membrane protein n=1 Tax=unclassified Ureibacillus TaxID=2638520 RepID=UPI00315829DC